LFNNKLTVLYCSQQSDIVNEDHISTDLKSIPGWNLVDEIAVFLLGSTSLAFTKTEADTFIRLYQCLSVYDKNP
jgi:hypothetical protein